MVHESREHHAFNPKRILLSLLLVLLLSICALFTSYKSIQVGSINHPQSRINEFISEELGQKVRFFVIHFIMHLAFSDSLI
jgi:hypothetical protein